MNCLLNVNQIITPINVFICDSDSFIGWNLFSQNALINERFAKSLDPISCCLVVCCLVDHTFFHHTLSCGIKWPLYLPAYWESTPFPWTRLSLYIFIMILVIINTERICLHFFRLGWPIASHIIVDLIVHCIAHSVLLSTMQHIVYCATQGALLLGMVNYLVVLLQQKIII